MSDENEIPQTVVDILLAARDLLSEEGSWCRGTIARAADNCPVASSSLDAVSFCAMGALYRVASNSVKASYAAKFTDKVAIQLGYKDGPTGLSANARATVVFNDARGRKRTEVVGLLDDAARLAKEELNV